ncbi:MAG: DUF342 domain-containing protein [Planctomycetota bacterium]|jgi:uncharacterized protein (DUF342 family)
MGENANNPIVVSIKNDGMVAVLSVCENQEPELICVDSCMGLVRDLELLVTEEITKEISAAVEEYRQNPSEPLSKVISNGTEPVHGENGRFELAEPLRDILEGNASSPEPESETVDESDDESVNYYTQSKYAILNKGDLIGTIIPHTEGVDGTTVTGKNIAAKAGRPFQINEHDSIQINDDGRVYAREHGVLQIDEKKVIVSDQLDIGGYVDFTTGNIHFPGNVTINKGVRDCFIVDAEGTITIRGLVEAACLRAGEDLHLAGGMAAREKGTILVNRDLHARYLGMAVGTVLRNVYVEREVVDSEIDVRGSVESDRCSWIGGRLAVTGACNIGELGGESGVRTELIAGRVLKADEQQETSAHIRDELARRLSKFQSEQEMLQNNTTKLNATQAERMTELQFEMISLQNLIDRLVQAERTLTQSVEQVASADVSVQRRINPGTILRVGEYDISFNEELKGPLRITLKSNGRPECRDPNTGNIMDLRDYATVRQREGNLQGTASESQAA